VEQQTRLKNKVAIVTGGGAGIGEAISKRYAQEGARVVVAEINSARGQFTVDAIHKLGGDATFVQTDVSSETQVKAMVETALKAFGQIDILVNNAAVLISYGQIRAHEMSDEEWERTINVNLKGCWLCSKWVLPTMLSKKSGSILFIASRTGVRGFGGFAAYSASKGGALALMRSMAADYAPDGIRVNAIIPGTMDTPMNAQEFSEPGAREKYIVRIPARRLGVASDIAGMATLLATEDASFCVGGLYFVDGGADLG
jgi:meso-butanediol dehydrogenase/(S,S)-butanediol dehydrogenase/diacetyl reductase